MSQLYPVQLGNKYDYRKIFQWQIVQNIAVQNVTITFKTEFLHTIDDNCPEA